MSEDSKASTRNDIWRGSWIHSVTTAVGRSFCAQGNNDAFGDQLLKWGAVGQIGHGSESVTSAFCVEALERLVEILRA